MAGIVPAPPVPVCCPVPARPPPHRQERGGPFLLEWKVWEAGEPWGGCGGVLCPEPNWGGGRVVGLRERDREVTVPARALAGEQTEVQIGQVTCPRSHITAVTEVRLEPWTPNFQPRVPALPRQASRWGLGGEPAEPVRW